MVRLTLDMVARGTSGYTKKNRDESLPHYLKRLTHLYLEGRNIDEIGEDLSLCRNLSVLYLYDNKLNKVPNLNQNQCLTHLYLQNNDISKIDGLGHLTRLTKLYIGGNKITVIEGLDQLDRLQELHAEHQKLPAGEQLLFDPRSLRSLSYSLHVLNLSGNGLNSIRDLEVLKEVRHFISTDNKLYDLKELAHVLGSWRFLSRLELAGNPFCQKPKYRDRIIVMAKGLDVLDGKEINETSRQFLINWKATKDAQKQKKRSSVLHHQGVLITEEGDGGRDLPPVNNYGRKVPTSGYMMPGLPRKQFDEVLARSASLPNSAPQGGRSRYSELAGPRILNTYGTTMKDPNWMNRKLNMVNIGTVSSIGAGDPS